MKSRFVRPIVLVTLAAAIPAVLPAQILVPGKSVFNISKVSVINENDEQFITFTVSPKLGTAKRLGVILFAPIAPDKASLKTLSISGGGGTFNFGTSPYSSETCWSMLVVTRQGEERVSPLIIQELGDKPKSETTVRVGLGYSIRAGMFSKIEFPKTGAIDLAIGQRGNPQQDGPLWTTVSNVVRVTLK